MTADDGLIDGATCDAFVATDWDVDKGDMAKKAARDRAAIEKAKTEGLG